MSLRMKWLAYGTLGVLGAGIGWVIAWSLTSRNRPERHHVYPKDAPE